MIILYFLIAIISTTVGAMTGMGGGVIMKPVLDMLGDFDVETIGMLSSIVVLAMSIVSTGKQVAKKAKINVKQGLFLGVGSVVGGSVGQHILSLIVKGTDGGTITAIQNIILAIMIIIVFIYMLNKFKIPSLNLNGGISAIVVGFLLGMISSFLGIGGGPINVAALIFILGMDTKMATINSIIIIFFSQISKITLVAITTGFSKFDFSMLMPMIIGAILGGFIGSSINEKLSEKHLDLAFNGVQVVVFGICMFNVAQQFL